MSAHALPGKLFVISAPSGAGKTTLCKALLERVGHLKYALSTTTRTPRSGEKNGVDYHFVSHQQFEEMIRSDAFVEYAQVFNNYYGTSKDAVLALLNDGENVLIDIDTQGAANIRKYIPECIQIFILPPSFEILEQRLRRRATDDDEVIRLRLSFARSEIERSVNYDYIIVNDTVGQAVDDLYAIYRAETLRVTANDTAIKQILEQS